MKRRVRQAAKVLLGRVPEGREVTIYPDDVLIVSYPKSGNTWARFLVGNLVLNDKTMSFANLEQTFPHIYQSDGKLRRAPRPRILKSHEYFDPRYKKVVYVVRDPRDVAVSYYHYHIKIRLIEDDYPLDRYVSRFVAGELDLFGSWRENVGSWLGAREGNDEFLLLRYEDMLEQPVRELRKVSSLLSVAATDEQLTRAVRLSSADRMRKLEKEQTDLWDLDVIKNSRKDKAFIRSAEAGSWRHELPEALVAEIEEAWGSLMIKLGYQPQVRR